MGNCETRPDYDYNDHPVIRVYHLAENVTISAQIPDIHGNTVNTVYARKENGKVNVWCENADTEMTVEIYE